jgi:hypothetical protein
MGSIIGDYRKEVIYYIGSIDIVVRYNMSRF